jgi:hypothetical protein
MNRTFPKTGLVAAALLSFHGLYAQMPALVNEPVDVSPDFRNFANTYFLGDSLAGFNTATASGYVCLPSQNVLYPITVTGNKLAADPLRGAVKWTIHTYNTK